MSEPGADGAPELDSEMSEPVGTVSPSFESNVRLTYNVVLDIVLLKICAVLYSQYEIIVGGGDGSLAVLVNADGPVRVSWNVPFAPGVSFVGPENAPFITPSGVIVTTVGSKATNVVSADGVPLDVPANTPPFNVGLVGEIVANAPAGDGDGLGAGTSVCVAVD